MESGITGIVGLYKLSVKKIETPLGMLLHVMRSDAEYFEQFGEVYCSYTNPGVVKGWKLHKIMKQNFVVPLGKMHFVFFDDRHDSSSRGAVVELSLSLEEYNLLCVPSGIWYSFQCQSLYPALIVNCATIAHDPDEVILRPLGCEEIPYRWANL